MIFKIVFLLFFVLLGISVSFIKTKNLFALFFVILIVCVAFGKQILNEIRLIRSTGAIECMNDLVMSQFYPLTEEEKINSIQDVIGKMQTLQDKLHKSFVAKYFVDYHEIIEKRQKEVKARMQTLKERKEDVITFSTIGHNMVLAAPAFDREHLLMLGCLIDTTFDSDECISTHLYFGEKDLVMEISYINGVIDEALCHEFAKQASEEIFDNTPIALEQIQ